MNLNAVTVILAITSSDCTRLPRSEWNGGLPSRPRYRVEYIVQQAMPGFIKPQPATLKAKVNKIPPSELHNHGGARMSKFVVLLVEDDTVLRDALADLLRDEGFEVIECATGEAAELIIATTGTELRAIVADHHLAGEMTGATLAGYALHLHPGMNIVIMSGTTVNLMPANATFLQKPFPMMRLLEAVRR